MPAYPGTLPQLVLQDGYGETARENSIRTSMEQGEAKVRKRYTAAIRKFSIVQFMTGAQVEIFDQFWENDLAFGSLAFSWVHPRTQVAAPRCRIMKPPSYMPVGPNFKVAYDLEILP